MDIGAPQLSMHSIREMCGAEDVDHSLKLFSVSYIFTNEIAFILQISKFFFVGFLFSIFKIRCKLESGLKLQP